ncbi:MAG: prealbumin-like fold domain-containing protein [Chloroflexi bacterium]|nr:prealbumin-like fold domain-containing protein [Chloroflexota bacterium]
MTITYGGDPGVLTIMNTNATDATVVFCAKGGTGFDDDGKNSGEMIATLGPDETQTFEFGTEISYFVLYDVTVDEVEEDDAGIVIEKLDEQDEPLAGAIFTVEGKDGVFTTGADGQVCVDGLPQDTTLTVTEIQAPAGYTIADPASQEVETDEDGCDDSAEVTFVNTLDVVEQPELGSITIIKNGVPDGAQDFGFTTTGAGLSSFSLDDDADATLSNEQDFTDLAAGTYTVAESATAGWTLTSIVCSTGGAGDAATRTATITLVAGANVTCTFLNTQITGSGNLPGGGGPPPRGGTLGGNPPLPNTAMLPELTGSAPAALAALLMLFGLGAGAWVTAAEVRRRR